MFLMAKTTSINLRISPEFRQDIEQLAAYHGLSMSSYAHSLLVKAIREQKTVEPEAFRGLKTATVKVTTEKEARRRKTG